MENKLVIELLSNIHDFSKLFCECKVKLKDEDFLLLFSLISQKREYRSMFGSRFFPQKVTNLIFLKNVPLLYNNEKYMEDIAFCNTYEMRYLINLVLFYKNKINYFCKMRDRFEKAVMYSRYEEAEFVLKEVFDKLGYSFWYIEARLLLSKVTGENTFLCALLNELELSNDLNVIKTYILILEDKISLDINQRLFNERFEDRCNKLKDKNDNLTNCLTEYIMFSCFEKIIINENLLRNLLTSSSYLSLVDSYILLEKIISRMISVGICCKKKEILCDNILKLIEKMSEDIDWTGWNNILVLNGHNKYVKINQEKLEVHHALKLFCEQKENECTDFCLNILHKYSNNLSVINLLAKCNVMAINGLCGKIVNILEKLYIKETDDYSFNSLIVECNIYIRFFSFFSFGNGLSVLVKQEIESQIPSIKEQYVMSLINYNFTPSKMVFFLPENNRLEFIENYRNQLKELYFCDWQMSTYEELRTDYVKEFIMDNISRKIIRLFNSDSNNIINEYKKSSINIINLKDRIYNTMLIKLLFDIFVSQKEYINAINIYLDAYFTSKIMVRKIDYKNLNRKLTYAVRESLESNIQYCVYIDITKFGKNYNEDVSEEVMNSFKRVLQRMQLDRPSNIVWPDSLREKQLVSYFWFNICEREVIGRLLPPFYIQQDIDDERLAIIEKLLIYYKEIGDERDLSYLINEKNKIEKERDLENISNCLNRGKINIGAINYKNETNDSLVLAVDRGVNYTAVLDNNNIDSGIFQEFIDTFAIIKKNYALEIDKMISVNIRHGILENELIRYFKKNGLCAKYEDNQKEKEYLKKFFAAMYKFIEELNENYIMASYKDKPKGISLYFDELLLKNNIYRLREIKTPDDLKQICLEFLNAKLKDELVRLGEIVYNKLYVGINENLDNIIINSQSIYTNQAIQCKDKLEYELSKIRDWFSFAENVSEMYKFNAWIEQLKEDYPYINIKSNAPDEFMLNSSRLNDMDILFHNLILNIFKHSGFEEDDSLLDVNAIINYKFINRKNIISLLLSNTVSQSKEKEDILSDIKMIKLLINQGEKEVSCLGDRKSGYKKIIRLLNRNYNNFWKLDPDYDDVNKKFIVKLEIEYEENNEESISS